MAEDDIHYGELQCVCGSRFFAGWIVQDGHPVPSCPRNSGLHSVSVMRKLPDSDALMAACRAAGVFKPDDDGAAE
jgi:hypothetical protein